MPHFAVRMIQHRILGPSDSVWQPADYRALLDAADFPDPEEIPDDELREMCVMALQELKPSEAAFLVLRHHLGDQLTPGQIKNLSHELGDEKHWEHYADMARHEGIFHVSSLLWSAFPSDYPTPDAVSLTVEVVPTDDESREVLAAGVDETLLVRLLADGMEPRAVLRRLFDDQLAGAPFPEASSVVWTWSATPAGDGLRIEVTGSNGWLGPVPSRGAWESEARPDAPDTEADPHR